MNDGINKKYECDNQERQKTLFSRDIASSAEAILTELEGDSQLPQSMHYFINLMRDIFVHNQVAYGNPPRKKSQENKKIIGTYCIMSPEELIYAAGAIPIRLCAGSYEASCAGEDLVPRDACPVVKASAGFTSLNIPFIYQMCDVVIVPTTCDGKRKLGEVLRDFKEVWMLEVPHIKETESSRLQWLSHLYALKKNIEKFTGKKISRKALRGSIQTICQAQYQAHKLYETKKLSLPVISGRASMLASNAYSYDTVDKWAEAMGKLNNELKKRQDKGEFITRNHVPRILLAGSPSIFPNWKILSLVEKMGAVVVADETCMGDRYLYDPVGIVEDSMIDMMRGIASRCIMPCTCPSFSPNDDRAYKLLRMIEEFRIDGILYCVLKGCIIYDFELISIDNSMKEKGISVLRIETDYSPEDVEQLRTRIEAFIEMIQTKKRKKR